MHLKSAILKEELRSRSEKRCDENPQTIENKGFSAIISITATRQQKHLKIKGYAP